MKTRATKSKNGRARRSARAASVVVIKPTNKDIRQTIQACIDTLTDSFEERDGIVRNPDIVREIAHLRGALALLPHDEDCVCLVCEDAKKPRQFLINWNDEAKVELTDAGYKIYASFFKHLGLAVPRLRNGVLTEPLWAIAQTFGPHLFMGMTDAEKPFGSMKIVIESQFIPVPRGTPQRKETCTPSL